jgi:hypothetical protein
MMTSLERSKQVGRLLIQAPSIGLASLFYSSMIQLSSLRADLLDITDPWWVVTVGLVLLLSPIYHIAVIGKVAAFHRRESFPLRSVPVETFGDLVLGELLVNALVVLGSAFLFLPGIYVGLRSIYYKQIIILHKARPVEAIRGSFRLTMAPSVMFRTLLLLSASYILPLTIEYLLAPMTQAWWIHLVAILISTSFLAWINGYITLSFVDLIPSVEGNQAAEKTP